MRRRQGISSCIGCWARSGRGRGDSRVTFWHKSPSRQPANVGAARAAGGPGPASTRARAGPPTEQGTSPVPAEQSESQSNAGEQVRRGVLAGPYSSGRFGVTVGVRGSRAGSDCAGRNGILEVR